MLDKRNPGAATFRGKAYADVVPSTGNMPIFIAAGKCIVTRDINRPP